MKSCKTFIYFLSTHEALTDWMASKIWLKMFFCELRVSSTATKKALFTFILSPTSKLPCCEAMGNIYSGHQNARNNYFWNVKSHFFLQKSIVYFYPITGQWSLLSELIVWKRGKLCCEDCLFLHNNGLSSAIYWFLPVKLLIYILK